MGGWHRKHNSADVGAIGDVVVAVDVVAAVAVVAVVVVGIDLKRYLPTVAATTNTNMVAMGGNHFVD